MLIYSQFLLMLSEKPCGCGGGGVWIICCLFVCISSQPLLLMLSQPLLLMPSESLQI